MLCGISNFVCLDEDGFDGVFDGSAGGTFGSSTVLFGLCVLSQSPLDTRVLLLFFPYTNPISPPPRLAVSLISLILFILFLFSIWLRLFLFSKSRLMTLFTSGSLCTIIHTYIHTSLHLYLSPLSLSSLHLFFPHFKKIGPRFRSARNVSFTLDFFLLPFCFIFKLEKTCYDYDDMDRIPAFLLPLLTSPLFISRFNSKFPRLFSSIMSLSPSYSSPPPTHLTSHESTYHTPGTTHGFLSPFFSFSLHIYLRPHLQFLHCSLFPPSPPPSLFSIHHYRITTNSLLGTTTTLHTIEFIILFPT